MATSTASGPVAHQETDAAAVVFATLPSLGMERMTKGGVEFVLCASALTAQV